MSTGGGVPRLRQRIQDLLRQVYQQAAPNLEITAITTLPANPYKGYIITTVEQHSFVLKTSPPTPTRLMRYEMGSLAEETIVLSLLNQAYPHGPFPRLISSSSLSDASSPTSSSSSSTSSASSNNALHAPYLLRSCAQGSSLTTMAHRLTSYDQSVIHHTLGTQLRHVTHLTKSQFGTVLAVQRNQGHRTWRQAFDALFEAAVRDAEDALLTLPYESIRAWVYVHMAAMDAVTTPHLVPLRAGLPETVMVDESRKVVAGIIAWGECVWGDPLLGEVFERANDSFWSGFGGRQAIGDDAFRERRRQM